MFDISFKEQLKWIWVAARTRLADESGISMVAALGAMVVGMSMSMVAISTAGTGITAARSDRYVKQAYQAAQSGVSDYVQRLSNDPNFWQACDAAGIDKESSTATARAGLGITAVNDTIYGSAYDTAYSVTLGGGHTERRWLPWAAASSTENRGFTSQYTIDLLPANGFTSCGVAGFQGDKAAERIVNNSTGTFRIRVTGRAGPAMPIGKAGTVEDWRKANWKKVSIVAEFRRTGFLDYAYFTDHEAIDPYISTKNSQSFLGLMAGIIWGGQNIDVEDKCNDYYRYGGSSTLRGREGLTNTSGTTRYVCPNERAMYNDETINGPMHTNDSLRVQSQNGPLFGNANMGDRIEIYDRGHSGGTCSGSGNVTGGCACPFRVQTTAADSYVQTGRTCYSTGRMNAGTTLITGPDAGHIDMPEGNTELRTWAGDPYPDGYRFAGKTTIVLKPGGIDVTNDAISGGTHTATLAYPPNGVIYVDNNGGGACDSDPNADYTSTTNPGGMAQNCALLEISGEYSKSLTIGSESDIVLMGDVKRSTGTYALLGLVAQNYIRIRHYPKSSTDFNRQSFCIMPAGADFGDFWDYFTCTWPSNDLDILSFAAWFVNVGIAAIQAIFGGSVTTPKCVHESVNTHNGKQVATTIQAAMLALKRSVTLDSSQCGGTVASNLTIEGAITQNWRGGLTYKDWKESFDTSCSRGGFIAWIYQVIGLCESGGLPGYGAKTFNYDYKLRALSPPHFLTPNESAWKINRIRQTVPACNCGLTG